MPERQDWKERSRGVRRTCNSDSGPDLLAIQAIVSALAGTFLSKLHWEQDRAASCSFKMISFSNINKQYGKQLLFVDASFQLNPGEKVGLVGPNGAGKTTLFRPIRTRFWLVGIGRYACSSTCRPNVVTIDPCRSHLPAAPLPSPST